MIMLSLYILCMPFVSMLLYIPYNINETLMDKPHSSYLGLDLKSNLSDQLQKGNQWLSWSTT